MVDDLEDPHDSDVYAPPRDASYKFIQLATVQGISRITLNRPPANVLSIDMMLDLNTAFESLEYQRDVKLVVLVGAGKYFSAGFELADHLGDRAYMMLEAFGRIFENLAKLDKPTLAVVGGPALGAGSLLAVGCDMVLAGAQSAKFGHPEIKGGVFNTVGAALLPRLVGRKKALEIIMGGASLTAADAERLGLVSRVCPDDKLEAEAAALIQRFQESSAPVMQLTRRAIVGGLDLPFTEALRHAEDVYLNQLMGTADAEEGLRAIMEKRRPAWKDR
ncbi:MAG TPA: enoyl-CoA hydratase/isomerase family protein [Vicinamibacteria bacterium]|nr:enoyl-CoA hydratase/isomerase family protein [Vicinamibacteria bacterium]